MSNDKLVKATQNPILKASLSLAEEASSIIPGLGLAPKAIKEYMEHKLRQAQEIFLKEISSGDVEALSDHEKQYLIPIGYKFYEAARTGTAKRNLRILAKIISGMIKKKEIEEGIYGRIEGSIRNLSYNELVVLSIMLKVYKKHLLSLGNQKIGIEKYIATLADSFTKELKNDFFSQRNKKNKDYEKYLEFNSILAVLSSYGWISPIQRPIISTGINAQHITLYFPTNLLYELDKLIDEFPLEEDEVRT